MYFPHHPKVRHTYQDTKIIVQLLDIIQYNIKKQTTLVSFLLFLIYLYGSMI